MPATLEPMKLKKSSLRGKFRKVRFADNLNIVHDLDENDQNPKDGYNKNGLFTKTVGKRDSNPMASTRYRSTNDDAMKRPNSVRSQVRAWFKAKVLSKWIEDFDSQAKTSCSFGWPVVVHSDGGVED